MAGLGSRVESRPGWVLEPDLDPVDQRLRERRWRILRAILPVGHGLGPMPGRMDSPEQFIDWLGERLTAEALVAYFDDLEEIAKQTCDLELLRLARDYRRLP